MSGQFAFSFAGDDIDEEDQVGTNATSISTKQTTAAPSSAFPVAGKPLIPARRHDLKKMLSELPSKIAYSVLDVDLDGNGTVRLPRRELWDVRVQLMAEDEGGVGGEAESGLGSHDVKTGVYEGGFKSWESSVDLVKVLAQSQSFLSSQDGTPCVIELGCGTALPSLALFQWAAALGPTGQPSSLSIVLADYNPTVLQLVTLPNFILSWALQALQHQQTSSIVADALSSEGELELSGGVIQAFEGFLTERNITLHFLSGAWSPEFVELVKASQQSVLRSGFRQRTVILGAETIYSPFALQSFTETVFSLMEQQAQGNEAEALIGAKKLYFGVGGSLDDFVMKARGLGAVIDQLREETEGVRRGVVRCALRP
ncbi:uncharacterized protein BCR38DRAFT_346865 [Pseudomassariella vexata]|uniref:protein-histidine N-methyltransferase n=1 Tax=Pseudomassariella vexata TaxID=1141098 RepID=A0A1Y2DSC7_9PEZI|nr:uncharacterized protein BCR38DRAFT_346865 [Pseudomassariella vexata]ORY62181.1 hypothetical protein BCR38DRAFT_346865 [Pseudomassariella vexata]